MKNILASIGFILAFLAIYMGLQIWYIVSVQFIISFMKAFEAGLAGDVTPDLEKITVSIQEAMKIHLPVALIFSAVLAALIYYFICRARKQNIVEVCAFNPISFKSAIVFVFTGISFLFFNGSLNTLIYESGYLNDSFQQLESTFAPFYEGNFLLSFASIAIVVPLIEEIIFRGLIQNELRKHMRVLPAVLIQAALFGLYHLNLAQFIITVFMGIMLGLLCVWTKSIWGAIIIHGVNNALSFLFAWFEPEAIQESCFFLNYIFLALTTLIIVSVMVYFFRRRGEAADQSPQTSEVSI